MDKTTEIRPSGKQINYNLREEVHTSIHTPFVLLFQHIFFHDWGEIKTKNVSVWFVLHGC